MRPAEGEHEREAALRVRDDGCAHCRRGCPRRVLTRTSAPGTGAPPDSTRPERAAGGGASPPAVSSVSPNSSAGSQPSVAAKARSEPNGSGPTRKRPSAPVVVRRSGWGHVYEHRHRGAGQGRAAAQDGALQHEALVQHGSTPSVPAGRPGRSRRGHARRAPRASRAPRAGPQERTFRPRRWWPRRGRGPRPRARRRAPGRGRLANPMTVGERPALGGWRNPSVVPGLQARLGAGQLREHLPGLRPRGGDLRASHRCASRIHHGAADAEARAGALWSRRGSRCRERGTRRAFPPGPCPACGNARFRGAATHPGARAPRGRRARSIHRRM